MLPIYSIYNVIYSIIYFILLYLILYNCLYSICILIYVLYIINSFYYQLFLIAIRYFAYIVSKA